MSAIGKAALGLLAAALAITSCEKPPEPAPGIIPAETPLLPVKPGDFWEYEVRLEIPAGVTSPTSAEVDVTHESTRRFLGKVSPAAGLPETDCFEVTVPGSAVEREFVEIHNDRILLRGSMILRPGTTQPLWFDQPVPFVFSNMQAGTHLPEVRINGETRTRKTEVISRGEIEVPAGKFQATQLLLTGRDGEMDLRRELWFAPGTGIVREVKTRSSGGKMLVRETHRLVRTSVLAESADR